MKTPITVYPSVQLWFKKAIHSPRGSEDALRRLRCFFEAADVEPSAIIEEWQSVRYDYRRREMFLDRWSEQIEAYYYGLDDDYAPTTRKSTVTPVISYFKHNKIPIEPDISDRIYVKYHNRDISKEEIQRILEYASLRDRAFFLVMAESGQRPYTLVQLRYKHIKEDFEARKIPMKIDLPAELIKDRVGHRFTFIGEDALARLKAYLRPRLPLKDDDLIFAPLRKGRMKGNFLSPEAFGNAFSRIVLKLDLDTPVEGGKPKGLRLYCLRKYFRNQIRVSDIGFREFWMGHTFGTDEHYLTRDLERHREEYAKAYWSVRIYTPNIPETITELRAFYEDKIDKLETKVAKIQPLIEFVNSFDQPENLKTILKFLKDDLASQPPDEKLRPLKTQFSPYISEKLNEIAERKGITQKEALEQLVKEDLETLERRDKRLKKLSERHAKA